MKRRNPRKQFATSTLTRAAIAAEISSVLAAEVDPKLLSDRLCQQYAGEYGQIQEQAANFDTDEDGREEAELDLNLRYARELGLEIQKEWADAMDDRLPVIYGRHGIGKSSYVEPTV